MSDELSAEKHGRRAVVLAAAVVSCLYAVRIHDPDSWWHLATGRWIVENRAIPRTDPFSFIASGEPWTYVNWLPDTGYYVLYAMGGLAALVVSKMVVATGLLTAVGLGARAAGARWSVATAMIFIVGILAQIRFALLRPNALGGLLLAASIVIALRWMSERGRSLWLLVPVAALWLPTHGTAILAPAVAVVAVVAVALSARREGLRTAVGVVGCVLLLFAIFPSGRHIIGVIGALDETSNIVQATIEWRRTDFALSGTWMPAAVVLLGLFGGAIGAWKSRSDDASSWAPLGFALGAAYLAQGFERNLAEALILASPGAAVLISWAADLAAARKWSLVERTLPLAAALALAGGHFAVEPDLAVNDRWGFGADEGKYPVDTLATLEALPPGRMINSFGIGGYLIWHEIPEGVFTDGRTVGVYTEEIFDRDVMPTMRDQAGLDDVADRYDVTYGLTSSGSLPHRIMMTSQTWIPVFHGESTSLFVRASRADIVTAAGRPLLPELRWDDEPGWVDAWYRSVLRTSDGPYFLARSIAQSNLESPNNPVLTKVVPYLNEWASAVIDRARRVEVELWP